MEVQLHGKSVSVLLRKFQYKTKLKGEDIGLNWYSNDSQAKIIEKEFDRPHFLFRPTLFSPIRKRVAQYSMMQAGID